MDEHLTQSAFAQSRGWSRSHVTALKQAGRLVLAADGKVDVAASLARIEATKDPNRDDVAQRHAAARAEKTEATATPGATVGQPDVGMSYQAARAVKERYNALTAKLDYERESGKLVEAEAARRFAADLGSLFRNALENLPDRIAPEIAPLSGSVDAARALLAERFEEILHDVATRIDRGLAHG